MIFVIIIPQYLTAKDNLPEYTLVSVHDNQKYQSAVGE